MDAETFITEVSGCGAFQIWLTLALYLVRTPGAWGTLLMAYGNYNPGWFCADVNTTKNPNASSISATDHTPVVTLVQSSDGTNNTSDIMMTISINGSSSMSLVQPIPNQCESVYDTCSNIQFDPSAITVVSEFGLICDKAWIAPTITSIQMAGVALSSNVAGMLADRYGRKTTLYCYVAVSIVANLAAAFSTSWQMLVPLIFLIGVGVGGNMALSQIFPLEFVISKWRTAVTSSPSWNVALVLLGVCFLWLKNWRHILMANAVLTAIAFLTIFWVPESLRWLLVHGRDTQANKVAAKIYRYNNCDIRGIDPKNLLKSDDQQNGTQNKPLFLDLFTPQLRRKTILTSILYITVLVSFYAIGFGIKSLFGDFYINFIIYSAIPILPVTFIGPTLSNIFGRKPSMITLCGLNLACCIAVIVVHFTVEGGTRGVVITWLAISMATWVQITIGISNTYVVELFPTVVRNHAFGFALMSGKLATIASPYIFPSDPDLLYISFAILGLMMAAAIVSISLLPETNKKALQEVLKRKKNIKTDIPKHTGKDDENLNEEKINLTSVECS